MKILINYADSKYKKTQQFNTWTGLNIAKFDKVYSFGPDDIEDDFLCENKDIFKEKRGNGLWLWKPYFIDRVLAEAEEGDIIFYCDSGAFFIRNIDYIINEMNQNENIWVSDIPLIEVNFTKPECFEIMDCDKEEIKYSNQIQATFFMVRCSKEGNEFVKQWLAKCKNYKLLSPKGDLSKKEGINEFVVHREDQSILSLLCKKNMIKPHLDPSQRGYCQEAYYSRNYKFKKTEHSDRYKTIIFLHKSPNIDIVKFIKIIIKMYINKIKFFIN